MTVKIVLGSFQGDCGKGRIVDYLTPQFDVVARASGGPNAGHVVWVEGQKYNFNHIPSGILHKGKTCVMGNGMVIEPFSLFQEIEGLKERGIEITPLNLLISSKAHVILPECIEEDKLKGGKIGTTGKGIGPTYRNKIARTGTRVGDIIDSGHHLLTEEQKLELKQYVTDTSLFVNNAINNGKNILCEAAQATLLDIDHGTYPFVTSSNTTAGGICTGLGIGPTKITEAVGVTKAYCTRVGNGPFVTELIDNSGEKLRKLGNEFGSNTGRPRRCGWLDIPALRYAVRINGLGSLAITKLDILNSYSSIPVCLAYNLKGKILTELPETLKELEKCIPVYSIFDGWNCEISNFRNYSDLPENLKVFLCKIGDSCKTPIRLISVGPERSQMIEV